MAKVEITAEQLKELVTKGRFTVEKKYMGGKLIGKFDIMSPVDVTLIAADIRTKNPRNADLESEEEYAARLEMMLNSEINTKSYSAVTESGEEVAMESWVLTMMDRDYAEMKARFEKLFIDGEYDDDVKYAVGDAVKN